MHRINFTSEFVADLSHPGIQSIISRLAASAPVITADQLVDGCLQYMGHYELADDTRKMLMDQAGQHGDINTSGEQFPEQVTKTCR